MSLTKLTITAYTSDSYSTKAGSAVFTAQINPETWVEEYNINYSATSSQGGLATKLRLDHIDSGRLTLNLVFDGTGLVSTTPDSLVGKSVAEQINTFKTLTMTPNGQIHEPNYLVLVWGSFSFSGLLTSLSIEYPLVDPNGMPLRARATATFESSQSLEAAAQEAGLNSPDMTHTRTTTAGDTLSQMCQNIYQDPAQYILVARHNGLNQVRRLPLGIDLDFPPLTV